MTTVDGAAFMAAQMTERISFTVPLPPPSLRGNARAHYLRRNRDADDYSRAIYGWALAAGLVQCPRPWTSVRVTYEWRYVGARPDLDNIARGIKVLQDCLCQAPYNAGRNRVYLGLIEDDGGIEEIVIRREKVRRRAAECIEVTIERIEGER